MRPQRYAFHSVWRLDAPVQLCWDFLTAPGQQWRTWWPQLRRIDVRPAAGLVGSSAACTWGSPIGYALTFELTVTAAEAGHHVELAATGDLTGEGRAVFEADGDGTRLDVTWQVVTSKRWMNIVAPVLGPVFRWGHDVAMRGGERGLNRALASAAISAPGATTSAGPRATTSAPTYETPRADDVDPGRSSGTTADRS